MIRTGYSIPTQHLERSVPLWRRFIARLLPALVLFGCAASQRPTLNPKVRLRGLALRYETQGYAARVCADREGLKRAVSQRLSRDPWVTRDASHVVVARFSGSKDRLFARIRLTDRSGTVIGDRRLSVPLQECEELHQSVGLLVSLALDPESMWKQPTSEASRGRATEPRPVDEYRVATLRPVAGPALASVPGPNARVSRPNEDRDSTQGIFGLALGPRLALGAGPSTSAGVGADLQLRKGVWSLLAALRADAPASASVVGGEVSTLIAGGSLSACGHYRVFFGCGGLFVAAMWAWADGLAQANTVVVPSVAGVATAGLDLSLTSRFFVRVRGELLFAATRTTLRDAVDGATFFETPRLSALLGASVGRWFD